MKNFVPTPIAPMLDFEPVPRKYRYDGWTAERRRAFIAALAETGSVKSGAGRIREMGGDVTVDSAPGQGARFVFSLPVRAG